MDNKKADMKAASTAAKAIAALDLVIAGLLAANGNPHFAGFMVLAGIMWAYSVYMKAKAEEIGD